MFEIPTIVSAILALSISDKNKGILVDMPALLKLIIRVVEMYCYDLPGISGCFGGGDDAESAEVAIECLLQLSFYFDSDEDLQSKYMTPELGVGNLMSAILALPSSRKVQLSSASKQSASNLLKRLTPKKAADTNVVSSGKSQHVMMSYAWSASKARVTELQRQLMEHGYDVWRDETGSSILGGMSGSTDEVMAEAIETSAAIIVCVSSPYKESANCRMEGKYAAARAKKGKVQLVFVMMDSEYTTVSENSVNGWLGFMIGDALWYPLWDDGHVHSTGNEIGKIIGDKGKIGMPEILTPVLQSSSTPAQTVSSPAPSVSVSQEKGGGQSREENGRLSKELRMASAYIILTDVRKAKPTEVAVLKQSLDDEGIDDPSVLRYHYHHHHHHHYYYYYYHRHHCCRRYSTHSKEAIEALSKHLKPAYSTKFLSYFSNSATTSSSEGNDLREENGRLSKELSMASAYIVLVDERKAKSTQVSILKQYLDDEGIDDPSVLR